MTKYYLVAIAINVSVVNNLTIVLLEIFLIHL